MALGELVENVFLIFGAAYEGPAISLGYATYILATQPEVQKKIQDEIDSILPSVTDADYSKKFGQMTYLEWFVREVQRFYPLASQNIDRQCVEDTIVNGIPVAAGMYILFFSSFLLGAEQ